MESLIKEVQDWAREKGIYDNSTAIAQLNGAIGELFEFREAVLKNKPKEEKEMEIGDICVFLVNAYSFHETSNKILVKAFDDMKLKDDTMVCTMDNFEDFIYGANKRLQSYSTWMILADLISFAKFIDSDLEICFRKAVDKILKRNGKMQNGKFVKESDLNGS